jgi:hypothetical protein
MGEGVCLRNVKRVSQALPHLARWRATLTIS